MPEATPDYATEILAYLQDKIRDSKKPITLDSKLVEELGFDSLDAVETTQDLEDQYGRSIPDEVVPTWKTGRDIVAYLGNPDGYIASRNITIKPKS